MARAKHTPPPDWAMRTRADEVAIDEGCWWDEAAGDRVCRFFLEHVCLRNGDPWVWIPWLERLTRTIFSWKRPDGRRRIRQAFIVCGKKNAKTLWTSGVLAYLQTCDGESGGELVAAARDGKQAGIVYRDYERTVKQSPGLRDALHPIPSKLTIEYPRRGNTFRVLSAAGNKEGIDAIGVVIDELSSHRDPDTYNVLRFAGAARKQPLLIVTTIAGYDRNSIAWEVYSYARSIVNGTCTDTAFHAEIHEVPEDADWTDEDNWALANPSFGYCQSIDDFRRDFQEARTSTAKELEFRRKRLAQWTQSSTTWIQLAAWDACAQPGLYAGKDPFLDGPVICGLDLASTTDLNALALVAPRGQRYFARGLAWVPEAALEERDRVNLFSYQVFAKDGCLTITRGSAADYGLIRRTLNDLRTKYQIKEIVIDKWNAMHFANELMSDGFEVYTFPQSTSYMTAPTKLLETLILEGRLVHDGKDSLLRWAIQNVVLEIDGNKNCRPSKKKSPDKIDPVIALVMAISRASALTVGPVKPKASVYDTRPALVF